MAYSLTGVSDLGSVTSESVNKDSNLFSMGIPASDSDSTIAFDIFGATMQITVSGTFIESSPGAIATFLGEIEALVDGSQDSITYHSDTSNKNYTVLVSSVIWNSEIPGTSITYTITLINCASTT